MFNLITDGSALAYANCGGWAYILEGGDREKSRSGAQWEMGSNQMELWAILEGLGRLLRPSDVTIYTDSHYVITGVKRHKHPEQILWAELYLWLQIHKVTFVKVGKGKANPSHTRAHHLAREAVFNAVRERRVINTNREQDRIDSDLQVNQSGLCIRDSCITGRCETQWLDADLQHTG